MPERGPFMAELIKAGVPINIWGQRWQKAKEWPQLRHVWRGAHLEGDNYAYAVQCAKVNLGLLSKGNRDLHTTRSMEICCLGGLLCAERTVEHEQLYNDGAEAVFWSDAVECVSAISQLLGNESRRKSIAAAGRARFLRNKLGNEDVVTKILAEATRLKK
jgi:spore maturation protein CgeB